MRAPVPKRLLESVRPPVRVPVRNAAPLLLSLLSLALACASGVPQTIGGTAGEPPPIDARTRALYARTNLEKARALEQAGRLDVAESVTRRGLSFEPDQPALLRLRADLLEQLGRPDEARALREHADRVDPPPPPLDDAPDPRSSPDTRVLVALLPPSPALLESPDTRDRLPRRWPADEAAKTLRTRFQTRLPDARVEVLGSTKRPSARSVPATRAWLAGLHVDALVTVRVDRSFCGRSVKDGDFAVAWLRVAVALPNAATADTHLVRTVLDRSDAPGCEAEALARAVEHVLALRSLEGALGAGPAPAGTPLTNAAIRAAFPELGARLDAEVAQGRRYLSLGELDLALERFRAATAIDPEDRVALSFQDDVQRTIELAGMLEPAPEPRGDGGGDAPGTPPAHPRTAVHLDPQLSPSQRRGLEAQLAHEKRRREEMLSTLAVMDGVRRAPTGATLAALHPGAIDDPQATGPTLARARAPEGRAVEMRSSYGPEGNLVARYYFPRGGDSPILREDDTDGDGHPDRWIAYEHGLVSEVWEAQAPGAAPTLHIVYAPGGAPIERVEIDQNGDGRIDRLFVYSDGRLREESSDTNGDGAFDRFQHFDESGSLTLREEDVDGDEQIDVRTAYNNGRIVRREILNQTVLDQQLGSQVQ